MDKKIGFQLADMHLISMIIDAYKRLYEIEGIIFDLDKKRRLRSELRKKNNFYCWNLLKKLNRKIIKLGGEPIERRKNVR